MHATVVLRDKDQDNCMITYCVDAKYIPPGAIGNSRTIRLFRCSRFVEKNISNSYNKSGNQMLLAWYIGLLSLLGSLNTLFAPETGKQIFGESSNSCGVEWNNEQAWEFDRWKRKKDYRKVLQIMLRTLNVKFYLYKVHWNFEFSDLQGKRKLVWKFEKSRVNYSLMEGQGRETTFGSSYWEVSKSQGRRNRNSTVG